MYTCIYAHSLQVFTQIASENGNFTTLEALRDCIGKQDDDRDHPVMEDQLASQRGDSAEGEVGTAVRDRYCSALGR